MPSLQGYSFQMYHDLHPMLHDGSGVSFGWLSGVLGVSGLLAVVLAQSVGLALGAGAVALGCMSFRREERYMLAGPVLGVVVIVLAVLLWNI